MKTLRKDEVKVISDEIIAIYGSCDIDKKDMVTMDEHFLYVNKICRFFKHKEIWIPTLRYILDHPQTLKQIAVDMGAVRFVCSGADVMRPGMTDIPEGIQQGEIVSIVDATHRKPLAIGQSSMDSQGLQAATAGKLIKNLHYIGDKVWKLGEIE